MKKEKVKTRFSVDLCGCFRFSKMLPEEALSVLVKMSEDYELGAEWYNEHFDIPYKIVAQECPWRLTADRQGLELIDDIGVINNNLFFIDWIAWIIMAFCLPNKVKMNGECSWVVGHHNEGKFSVEGNRITVDGDFCGSDSWKMSVARANRIQTADYKKRIGAIERQLKRKYAKMFEEAFNKLR